MSDVFSRVIHEWFFERYPDPEEGAYLNFDAVVTLIRTPNLKVFYREEVVDMQCWFTYGGVAPAQFRVLYADPKMFEKLEQELNRWDAIEKESPVRRDRSLRGCNVTATYERLKPRGQGCTQELVVSGNRPVPVSTTG